MSPSDKTVSQLGEFGLIDALTEVLGGGQLDPSATVLVGPGDDAAVVQMSDTRMVISTDAMVENVHFKRAWSSGVDVGVRAAAANLSDIVAMGADPTALVVAFVVVGGDVVAASFISVTVTAIGAPRSRIITRAGAQVGDVLAVAGRLGWAAAGLAVATRGFSSPRVLVDAHRRPVIDYHLVQSAFEHAHALCDVSDGLVADARHLATASDVHINISTDALAIPDPLRDMGQALTEDPMNWILTGGDDHAFLGAFDPAHVPTGWTIVGQVTAGYGVSVDGTMFEGSPGHRHF